MADLFIDGSSSATLIGLTNGLCRTLPSRAPSDGVVFHAIQELLEISHLSLQDLSSIAAGSGPGSHTGTRAIAAIAKGLALGLKKPFKLFPSLLLFLPQSKGALGTSLPTKSGQFHVLTYDTLTLQVMHNGLMSSDALDALKPSLDAFGYDYSPCHLANFIKATASSSLNTSLDYLNFP
ncbi:MAG: hypothetical protein KGZ39_05320 [Simkania sp.]|nr:hypothetical protein [Simkania sp.]